MRMAKPQVVEIDYVQRMLASLLWLPGESLGQGQAVQLGLGAGAITRFTARQLGMATTVVEINPEVIAVNGAWFHLPPEAEVVRGDAADWLKQAEPASVQLLHVDLYDEEAAAPVLDDEAFYTACHAVLAPGGVMSVNLFGRDTSFQDSLLRIASAFGAGLASTGPATPPSAFGAGQVWSLRPTREGNTVVVAGRDVVVPGREVLAARAAALETRFGALGLPAGKWLRMVRPYVETTAGAVGRGP